MNAKVQLRRILTEAFGEGRLEVLDEVLTEDFVNHSAPTVLPAGLAGVKKVIEMERAAFPDLRYEILREIQEDDIVVQHATVHGTHRGPIFGVPATGRTVQWNEIHIARVRQGRCSEHWACNDMASLWVQLGRATPPEVVP
jgi:predicted ester cyclase